VIVLASLGAVAAFWLGLRLGGPKLALLAAALYVVMPGHQVYSVTSMDAIFNASIGFGAVAFFLALEPRSRPGLAVLAGTLIALGLMFTYAATQLFFFGLALVILGLLRRQGARHVLQQAAIAAGTLALLYLLLYVTTGFNVVEGALKATANNARHINRAAVGHETQLITPPTLAYYTYYLGVNIVPFAWYLAPWGLAALTQVVPAGWRSRPRLNSVHLLALGLVAWVGGMWLSGIFIREVERIWGFTYPLAAAVIAYHVWQGANRREQLWRAALYISLFWTQSAVMRMLLNTYW
jgi:4-amino-4-deoxy-L-arabinose transferase-like glycosyltransferase